MFAQNDGEFFRLPAASKDKFPAPVWNFSGGRIRLLTDSTALAVRLEYPSPPNMNNMHAFGKTGMDLYSDGAHRGTAIADKDAQPEKVYEHVYFSARPRAWHEVTLHLSLYKPLKVIAVWVTVRRVLKKPAASPSPGQLSIMGRADRGRTWKPPGHPARLPLGGFQS